MKFFPILAMTSVAQQSKVSMVVICTSYCATHFNRRQVWPEGKAV